MEDSAIDLYEFAATTHDNSPRPANIRFFRAPHYDTTRNLMMTK